MRFGMICRGDDGYGAKLLNLPHKVVDDEADKEVLVNANARL